MSRNTSSSSFSSGESPVSSSSSDDPICAPAPIVPLRVWKWRQPDHQHLFHTDKEGYRSPSLKVPNLSRNLPRLRSISERSYGGPNPYGGHHHGLWRAAKAKSLIPHGLFFTELLQFHKLSVAQLYPNSWRILVAFRFVCLITTMSQTWPSSLNCTIWVLERTKSSDFLVGENTKHYSTGYPHP